jgi:hypothetical protein
MSSTAESIAPWRDLTDPRRAATVPDLEAGLKEPIFENLEIPEALGPVTITVDDHKIKRFSFTQDDYAPWYLQASPFDGARIGWATISCSFSPPAIAPARRWAFIPRSRCGSTAR